MLARTPTLHSSTPTLTVTDPRGLPVRSVGYCRIAQGGAAEARVNRTAHDPAGRAIAQWDPRLFSDASAPANLVSIYSLSGKVLSSTSVDAGWRVSLWGEADQRVHSWDGRGSQRRLEYDTLLRPQAVFEQEGELSFCSERYLYGGADPGFVDRNQCGQLIRHDDPAGTGVFAEFGLMGQLLEQTEHFLRQLDSLDWPEELLERNKLLEPGAGATTRSRFNPLGDVLEQSDAKGNRQSFSQTVGGQLRESQLQLKGPGSVGAGLPANVSPRFQSDPQLLVSAIQYNAHGQTERETAGNGVITTLEYRPEDGRLIRLQARRSDGGTLQDLNYCYDPVGNVLSIADKAQPIRYFANQRIDPISRYVYDSLYQLIQATGWEAGGPNKGPHYSGFDDPAPRANYRQTYCYDEGGNLLKLTHDGPQHHGRTLTAARHSNRCLPEQNDGPPSEAEIAAAFDANGNLLNLQPGQALSWDLRNQLKEVRPVARDSGLNDSEGYVYGADGMRRRKVRSTQTNVRTLNAEIRYLSGLEIRNHSGTGEVLHVIVAQAGRSSVRVLHWETEPPKGIANNQLRYNAADHLGSCTLELDSAGEVISQENYHPFGSTAWFAGRGEVEASYKTVRYSGKERDATGLYYYGFRYYINWLQRWTNPDPALNLDGLNMFAFVGHNPIRYVDKQGMMKYEVANLFRGTKVETPPAMRELVQHNIAAPPHGMTVNSTLHAGFEFAYDMIWATKGLMVLGAGNQIPDLLSSQNGSESHASQVRDLSVVGRSRYEHALAAGAGLCNEFAGVTAYLASSSNRWPGLPVSITSFPGHMFSLLGDSRISDPIVMDSWVTYPIPHLFSQSRYSAYPVTSVDHSPRMPGDPFYELDTDVVDQLRTQHYGNIQSLTGSDWITAIIEIELVLGRTQSNEVWYQHTAMNHSQDLFAVSDNLDHVNFAEVPADQAPVIEQSVVLARHFENSSPLARLYKRI
ncbi:RHS repeat domain-containing protein [Pseudomonas fluorescens]|uniref:Uncharacterized protein n=1 Tax=Pseudomonas fluorescens TaxID=294 RepID=A0A5E7DJI3_PSEFL|nr:RHS repeat-associated core domain-containing protein [Pseudomonas fluorescens]VVO08424.1 hypothetical protein PS723_03214 [Pseudomonas fluorescens]